MHRAIPSEVRLGEHATVGIPEEKDATKLFRGSDARPGCTLLLSLLVSPPENIETFIS